MSERRINVQNGKIILVDSGSQKVTADYDQLTVGGRGFQSNPEEVNKNSSYKKELGSMDESAMAVTVELRDLTKKHMGVHHGPECYNPFPEPVTGGTFFIPKGNRCEVEVCTTEKEVVSLYNKYEKEFNLPANQLWGWKRNSKGKYEIDNTRLTTAEFTSALSKTREAAAGNTVIEEMVNELEKSYRQLCSAKMAPFDQSQRKYNQGVDEALQKFNNAEAQFFMATGKESPLQTMIKTKQPTTRVKELKGKWEERTRVSHEHKDIVR